MNYLNLFTEHSKLIIESKGRRLMKSLRDFEDKSVKGTIAKNNQIYTSLYDYHMSIADTRRRENAVGWLATGSQERNFLHVLPHLEEADRILDYGCGMGDFIPYIFSELEDFDYVGVDINPKFIEDAKKRYSGFDFYNIQSTRQLVGEFDKIAIIGVFTWYISKEDFIKTIRHLYSICKKKIIITCISSSMQPHSWTNTYRGYDEEIFKQLFPEMNIEFENKFPDLVVVINKN